MNLFAQIEHVIAGRTADGRTGGFPPFVFDGGRPPDTTVHAGISAMLSLIEARCGEAFGDAARTSLIRRLLDHYQRHGCAPFDDAVLADLKMAAAWIADNSRHLAGNASVFKLIALARRERPVPPKHVGGVGHAPLWMSMCGLFDCCEILNAAQLCEADRACHTVTPWVSFLSAQPEPDPENVPEAYHAYWRRRDEREAHRHFAVRENGVPCALMIFRGNQLYELRLRNRNRTYLIPCCDSLAAVCKTLGDIRISPEVTGDIGHVFLQVVCARIGLPSEESHLLRGGFRVPEVAPAGIIYPHPLQLRPAPSASGGKPNNNRTAKPKGENP